MGNLAGWSWGNHRAAAGRTWVAVFICHVFKLTSRNPDRYTLLGNCTELVRIGPFLFSDCMTKTPPTVPPMLISIASKLCCTQASETRATHSWNAMRNGPTLVHRRKHTPSVYSPPGCRNLLLSGGQREDTLIDFILGVPKIMDDSESKSIVKSSFLLALPFSSASILS